MIGAERDFWPLPTTVIASTVADRRVGAPDRQRLGNAQTRAVEERQHGGVARQHPGLARLAFAGGDRGHGSGVRRAQRPRQAARGLWSAQRAERRGRLPALARDVAGERPQGRERALERPALDAFRPPAGEKGAQVRRRAIGEIGDCRRRAEPLAEKGRETAARRGRKPRSCAPTTAARRRDGRATRPPPRRGRARPEGRREQGSGRASALGWSTRKDLTRPCRGSPAGGPNKIVLSFDQSNLTGRNDG